MKPGGSNLRCAKMRIKKKETRVWKRAFSGRPRFGSVRLRFGDGTVQAVPVFGSGGSSAKTGFVCISVQFDRKGGFRFRFLENGSGGSGSAFGFRKNGSDGSGFRFRFGCFILVSLSLSLNISLSLFLSRSFSFSLSLSSLFFFSLLSFALSLSLSLRRFRFPVSVQFLSHPAFQKH